MSDRDGTDRNEIVIGAYSCCRQGLQGSATQEKDTGRPEPDEKHGTPDIPGQIGRRRWLIPCHRTARYQNGTAPEHGRVRCQHAMPSDNVHTHDNMGCHHKGEEKHERVSKTYLDCPSRLVASAARHPAHERRMPESPDHDTSS